jgi:hypothetical protein
MLSKFAIKWAIFCASWKFGSFGYNQNRTEGTETEVSRFLILKRTEWFLVFRNQTFSRTEEPNRPNAQGDFQEAKPEIYLLSPQKKEEDES